MLALGSLAFASPWLLAALAALPVIWWLLRVTPPAPRRIVFPAIRLLLGLTPREETPARTPWWLILLRTVLAALEPDCRRSEEHTSELQSRQYLVCRLLLEKKKK